MKLYRKLFSLIIFLLICISWFVGNSLIESIQINKSIQDFKNRGTLNYIDSSGRIYYYKVTKKYDYEDIKSPIYSLDAPNLVGTTGDICISDHDPLHGVSLMKWLSSKAWIGHSGLVYDSEGTKTIEIVGNLSKENNVISLWDNDWLSSSPSRMTVIRVKDMNDDKRAVLKEEAEKLFDKKYNYLMVFSNDNKFYCSDFVSYLYKKIDININSDYFLTTGADMISNENTYIVFYYEVIKNNNIKNIYYLSEE